MESDWISETRADEDADENFRRFIHEHPDVSMPTSSHTIDIGRPTSACRSSYVTGSTDPLGIEWCAQISDYIQLKHRFAATSLEKLREDTVSSLKTIFADIISTRLVHCTEAKAKLSYVRGEPKDILVTNRISRKFY